MNYVILRFSHFGFYFCYKILLLAMCIGISYIYHLNTDFSDMNLNSWITYIWILYVNQLTQNELCLIKSQSKVKIFIRNTFMSIGGVPLLTIFDSLYDTTYVPYAVSVLINSSFKFV